MQNIKWKDKNDLLIERQRMQSELDDFPMFHTVFWSVFIICKKPVMCDEISLVDLKPRICLKIQFVLFLYTWYYLKKMSINWKQ